MYLRSIYISFSVNFQCTSFCVYVWGVLFTNFRYQCVCGFLFFFFNFCHVAYGISQLPNQGSNSNPSQWKQGVLAIRLPGKSWMLVFFYLICTKQHLTYNENESLISDNMLWVFFYFFFGSCEFCKIFVQLCSLLIVKNLLN